MTLALVEVVKNSNIVADQLNKLIIRSGKQLRSLTQLINPGRVCSAPLLSNRLHCV